MTESERPSFGVSDRGDGFFTRPEAEWEDAEVKAGLRQIENRIIEHARYVAELEALHARLVAEQGRRRELYASVAALLAPAAEEGEQS